MKFSKLVSILMISAMSLSFVACSDEEMGIEVDEGRSRDYADITATETTITSTINLGYVKDSSSIGLSNLMEDNTNQATGNVAYDFAEYSSVDDITSKFLSGKLDVAIVPTEVASILYNKTNGGIRVVAINSTNSSLNVVETGDNIKSIADLENKTIYAENTSNATKYILEYILKQNNINNVKIEAKGLDELISLVNSDKNAVGILSEPQLSETIEKNPAIKTKLKLDEEWQKSTNSELPTSCIVVSKTYSEKHPRVIRDFLQEYYDSFKATAKDSKNASTLAEKFKITTTATVAEKEISNTTLTYLDEDKMKAPVTNYLTVLFNSGAEMIGGQIPSDDIFYFPPKEKFKVEK